MHPAVGSARAQLQKLLKDLREMPEVFDVQARIADYQHPYLEITSLTIVKAERSKGKGRHVMELFRQLCQQNGIPSIRLLSTASAEPFYQKLGYKRVPGSKYLYVLEVGSSNLLSK